MLAAGSFHAVRFALREPATDALGFDLSQCSGLLNGQHLAAQVAHRTEHRNRLKDDPLPLEGDDLDPSPFGDYSH